MRPSLLRHFPQDVDGIRSVGIGAYLGGAITLMDNPDLLTAATSILTVEARHDSFLQYGLGASSFPSPFDTSLSGVFAYNLAQMFIVSCPQQLPIVVLPKLELISKLAHCRHAFVRDVFPLTTNHKAQRRP